MVISIHATAPQPPQIPVKVMTPDEATAGLSVLFMEVLSEGDLTSPVKRAQLLDLCNSGANLEVVAASFCGKWDNKKVESTKQVMGEILRKENFHKTLAERVIQQCGQSGLSGDNDRIAAHIRETIREIAYKLDDLYINEDELEVNDIRTIFVDDYPGYENIIDNLIEEITHRYTDSFFSIPQAFFPVIPQASSPKLQALRVLSSIVEREPVIIQVIIDNVRAIFMKLSDCEEVIDLVIKHILNISPTC